jgi:Holliday junction resolvasome RuvABC endonuclease subunit
MSSFLDTLPDEETWHTQESAGVDPDLHTTGIAIASVARSSLGRKRLDGIWMRSASIDPKLRELDAVNAMTGAIDNAIRGKAIHQAIVESQQLYYRKNDSKAKIVGQGNDLIMLATISGIATALLFQKHVDVAILKPARWKGQANKEAMHDRLKIMIKDILNVDIDGHDSHCLDALCMALVGAGFKV